MKGFEECALLVKWTNEPGEHHIPSDVEFSHVNRVLTTDVGVGVFRPPRERWSLGHGATIIPCYARKNHRKQHRSTISRYAPSATPISNPHCYVHICTNYVPMLLVNLACTTNISLLRSNPLPFSHAPGKESKRSNVKRISVRASAVLHPLDPPYHTP